MDTHLIRLSSPIGAGFGRVDRNEVLSALPDGSQITTELHINLLHLSESDPQFWHRAVSTIQAEVETWRSTWIHTEMTSHSSVFAFAPIPLLMVLGRALGEHHPCDLYQRHRTPPTWCWPSDVHSAPPLDIEVRRPPGRVRGQHAIALLSLSGSVDHQTALDAARARGAEGDIGVWEVAASGSAVDIIKSPEHIHTFWQKWREALGHIHDKLGDQGEVHVFPALPIPLAIEVGRRMLPGADPTLHIYDRDRLCGSHGQHYRLSFVGGNVQFLDHRETSMKLPIDLKKRLRAAIEDAVGHRVDWLRMQWTDAGLKSSSINWDRDVEVLANSVVEEAAKQPIKLVHLVEGMATELPKNQAFRDLLPEIKNWSEARQSGVGPSPTVAATLPAQRVLLLLGAVADDATRIGVSQEFRDIPVKLRASPLRGQLTIEQIHSTRWDDLRSALLAHKPQWVHLAGHGERGSGWELIGPDGGGESVAPEVLEALFSLHRTSVNLVVLNFCESGEAARLISRHITYVFGHSKSILDPAARQFGVDFFEALFEGKDIPSAFALARVTLLQKYPDQAKIPRLFKDGEDITPPL